ncbi:beta strand repeat-containing protein, partial [Tunturiibacter gelidoferens]
MSSHRTKCKSRSGYLKSGSRSFSGILLAVLGLLLATVSVPESFALGAATTTSLTLSSATVTSGTMVTLTAAVTTGVSTPVSPGLITFCDATATHCVNSAILGTAQLTATGTAVLRLIPGIGTHKYIAVFNGTNSHSSSSSPSQTLSVTGTYATGTTLTSTGTAGNYTLAATVVGNGGFTQSPTAALSFVDTSNSNYVFGTSPLGAAVAAQTFNAAASASGTGIPPRGSALGDFNGDGKLDIAVASAANKVNILLGTGTGTFTTGTTLTAGLTPIVVAVGDFNNDGILDLAVTNAVGNSVSIFFGRGNGTFQNQVIYLTGITPSAVAVGDFNNDGNADLAITNQASNTVTVLLNNGNGTFTAAPFSPFTVGAGPLNLIVSDFNGDGKADIAVTNFATVSVSILLGDGTGNFSQASGSPIDVGRYPTGLVAGDFNGDGIIDIAVPSSNDDTVGILIGNGNGTFQPRVVGANPVGAVPIAIALGDFNGDGKADLTVVNQNNTTQSVLLGNGDGTFQAAVNYTVGATGSSTLVGDFNGDGFPDIATPVQSNNNVAVLLDQITQTATATLNTPNVPAGAAIAHKVDAVYPGETYFAKSTSNLLSLTGTPITTATLLSANPSSSTYSQQVVLSATLSPYALGGYTTNNELITFLNGATVLGTSKLSSGIATLNVTSLPVGTDSLTASFNLGSPTDANFLASTSSPINYPVAKTTPVITWATPAPINYGILVSSTQLNATTTVAGTFSYSVAAYTLLPVGTYTLSATFTPSVANSSSYSSATASVTLVVNPANPQISWPSPAPITYPTPLSNIQLDATVAVYAPVPLTSYYNLNGIYSNGTSFSGGFDQGGNAYSSNLLGTSVTWNNITYQLGPANALDAVGGLSSTGTTVTIALPAGYYASLNMLGAMVNNSTAANPFIITYTDGTTSTYTQSLSDWVYPMNYPGETEVTCVPYRNTSGGGEDSHLTCVYGYSIPLNSSKIVQSVTLPAWQGPGDVSILAMDLVSPPIPGALVYSPTSGTVLPTGENTLSATFTPTNTTNYTGATASVPLLVNPASSTVIVWPTPASITYGTPLSATQLNAVAEITPNTTSVSLSSYYRVNAFQSNGSLFSTGGFDNIGNAYSSNSVGTSITWNGQTYSLGPANLPDAVTSTVIALPQGAFSGLTMIGAATIVGQTSQRFTITYTDGTTVFAAVSLDSWTQTSPFTPYPGESIVSTTAFRNTSSGGQTLGTTYLYGYTIPLDNTKTVQSITLPNNRNVVIVAMALNTAATPTVIPGSYVYTPPAGTVLPVGTNKLSVQFTPTNPAYGSATGTVNLVVNKQALLFTANNETAVYGTPVPPYTYTVTGYVNGDTASTAYSGNPSLTTIPAAPTTANTYTITAAIGSLTSSNYSLTFATGTLTITQASPTVTWTTPANITYGTALTNTQLNATASVPGSFTYTPALGSIPAAGVDTLSVTFKPTDSTDYSSVTKTVQITVNQATPVITWANPAAITYGTALSATQLNATASVPGSFTYSPAIGNVPGAGTVSLTATFTPTDTVNYTTATKTVQLVVNQAAPVITWANPAAITYGTALSAIQLNATASVAGTFTYTPAAGSVPGAGTDTLSVTFTPTDTTDYSTATKTVQIVVNQATPVITWATPAAITYGTALSATQLNATASVAGTFTYTPASGTIPGAGTDTLSVTFKPTDSTDYTTATATVQLIVNKATPVITWANPAAITYGTALSNTQLNATASVAGSFVYTPAVGNIPAAGTDTLSVTFTPTDATDYTTATKTVQIVVNQATPVITWANPAAITYGTALSATQLNATASVAGTFTYTPAVGNIPAAGTDTLSVTFTPTDATDYTTATKTVQIVVNQATPVITWANPAAITYGTALSATQLNATASVAGTFTYTPAIGNIPAAGTDTLSVTFTPTDTTNYTSATKTVQIVVTQAVPVITWANPAAITYGTALSATQLNATASVAGTFIYSPASGATPGAGTDTLSVTFKPTDATDYTTATATVQLVVNKATPVITWANPAAITYGTALSATQLNASASVAGSFAYSPAAGSIPAAGTDTLSVTFTPSDATDYTTATATVQLVVNKASPVITWANPAAITYGTALSATQLNATASVAGSFAYTPAAGNIPTVGTNTLSVTFTPTDAANYTTATKTVQIIVNQATPVITWANPAAITYGTALSATQLNATASVAGSFAYTPAIGNVPAAGTDTLSVTFTPTDTTNYTTATKTVQIVVTQASPVITWANPASITYGTALSATQLDATASVPGSFTYTPAIGNIPAAGTDTLSVTFTPTDTTNYSTATKTVQIVVTQAVPVITWANPASITYGTALSATQLNATASVPGSFAYTPAAGNIPAAGTDTLSVTFTPTDTTNYTTATKTVQIVVTQASPVITWANPASITYGTALSAIQLNATASVAGSFAYTPAAGSIPAAGT